MDASNATLINVTVQEAFNATSSNISIRWRRPVNYYEDTMALLWRVIPPILISIGTIGNALTIFVLLRQKKMTSTAVFLFALALSDTLMLFSGLMVSWLKHAWGVNTWTPGTGCKAEVYLRFCSTHLSSWLTVAVTLERTACVLFPHKVKLGCSPRNAVFVIVTIVLAVFGINIILIVTEASCNMSTKEYLELFGVYGWIHFTLMFGAPFPLLLIGNVIIVVQLARSRSRRRRMNISGQVCDTRPVSMLMIALCVLFLLTMTPSAASFVISRYPIEKVLMSVDFSTAWNDLMYIQFVHNVAHLVSYFNATFNFAMYVFSGSKFRGELRSLLCCKATKGTNLFGK